MTSHTILWTCTVCSHSLAAALIESLNWQDAFSHVSCHCTNFVSATVDGNWVKAPDWFYVRSVLLPAPTKTVAANSQVRGSPGDRHGVLSETDGGEYS